MSSQWTRREAAHLLRRAGFFASSEEVENAVALGRSATVDKLLAGVPLSNDTARSPLPPIEQVQVEGKSLKADAISDQQLYWIYRMMHTPSPLTEKMALFWHGHFATSNSKVDGLALMVRQIELFRTYALGDFKELVRQVGRDPAMMLWLDITSNQKGRPNENYAREVLELFTLGIGPYTEQDIREGARTFTGWKLDKQAGKVSFDPKLYDDGTKQVLGEVGRWDAEDTVDIIFRQSALAMFMARKLLRFFAIDEPPEDWVERVADRFVSSGYRIGEVLRGIFLADDFYEPRVMSGRVRSPVEYTLSLLLSLELPLQRGITVALREMGQELFLPPDVSGWAGGERWLAASSLLARSRYAARMVYMLDEGKLLSPRFLPEQAATPEAWVRLWTERAGVGELGAHTLKVLTGYAKKCLAREIPSEAFGLKGLLYLILVSPEAQLA
ncbi:DUF1800 family protein [Paenibacillus chartarius]|uniref:DUF1800 family protein n=1 Tax=Paenibacillus chartarius TaxID=747481 RepID=A0ABV6DUF9_9BACL